MIEPQYTFRQATEEDFDFLYNLMKTTMMEHVVATWGPWDEEFQVDYFKKKFDPSKNQIIVVDGKDAGAIKATDREKELFVERLFLLPEYQGQGIGSSVISEYIERAKSAGKALTLTVIKANERVLGFYKRLGLDIVDENEERYTISTEKVN